MMSPSQENRSISCSLHENGNSDSLSLFSLEKAVHEILQQPLQGIDEHLLEFSKAMRTVAKALRCAAEGKASAQAEAAEWKRKFELEKARNMQLERKALPSGNHRCNVLNKRTKDMADQPKACHPANGQNGWALLWQNWNLQSRRDGGPISDYEVVNKKILRKGITIDVERPMNNDDVEEGENQQSANDEGDDDGLGDMNI